MSNFPKMVSGLHYQVYYDEEQVCWREAIEKHPYFLEELVVVLFSFDLWKSQSRHQSRFNDVLPLFNFGVDQRRIHPASIHRKSAGESLRDHATAGATFV